MRLIVVRTLLVCLLGLLVADVAAFGAYDVDTFAGVVGAQGTSDGTVTTARFAGPQAMAFDAAGNLYIADTLNHTIRKVSTAGVATTLAGLAGSSGSTDATGSAARFNTPTGVALDSAGNVYVADRNNHVIRKITSAGVVTTLAGSAGNSGNAEGTGAVARFNLPEAVAVDSSGNVYVADTFNCRIRKVTSGGVTTTLAGSSAGYAEGTGTAAKFSFPRGIAVNSAGTLVYVADTSNFIVRQVTSGGVVTTVAGLAGVPSEYDGSGRFGYPVGIALSSTGTLYVTDTLNHIVTSFIPGDTPVTFAGAYGSPGSADGYYIYGAQFRRPTGIAIDPGGLVYVADTGNHTIRQISPTMDVMTFAGLAGTSGSTDGTLPARFSSLGGVARDSAGNLYVADTGNHVIRKITPAGTVTVLAGAMRIQGNTNGTGSAARFNYPSGVAVDSAGNVYVGDNGNNCVRKITSAGVVTLLAGSGQPFVDGWADGTGINARFIDVQGVAVDAAGTTVYVAEPTYNIVRKIIVSTGAVSTIGIASLSSGTTNGASNVARFYGPTDVAVDSSGNVFVADRGNNMIRKITSGGTVSLFAGSTTGASGTTDATGTAARFFSPSYLAIDSSNNLYVADRYNFLIRKITSGAVVSTIAGSSVAGSAYVDGIGSAARFDYGVAGVVSDSSGNLWITDGAAIRKCSTTALVSTFVGGPSAGGMSNGTQMGLFGSVRATATDSSGNIYVADAGNHTIRKITPAGITTTLAGSPGTSGFGNGTGSAATFNTPQGIAVDSAGNVYVADTWNHSIRKITSAGVVTTLAGTGSPGSTNNTGTLASFNLPSGVAVEPGGANIYVADTSNHLIRKVTSAGAVTTLAGATANTSSANGTGGSAGFADPQGVAWDAVTGSVFVADGPAIRKVTTGGVASTYAGSFGPDGYGGNDGTGAAAKFNSPGALTADASGNLFVADTYNHTLRKIAAGAVVTTIAGVQYATGSANGPGPVARFNTPSGIAVDGSGILYVADTENNVVRKATVVTETAPTIVIQPEPLVGTVGNSVTFFVVAKGTAPLSYQWKKAGVNIAGATTDTLTLNNLQNSDAANYSVTVSNSAGSVNSNSVALSVVIAPPEITDESGDIGVTSGKSTSFSIAAIGANVTVQWQLSTDNGTNWSDLSESFPYSNVTSLALGVKTSLGMNLYRFRCRATNSGGTAYSDPMILTVNPLRPGNETEGGGFTQQPVSQTVLQNSSASFTVFAKADPAASYQWQISTNGGSSWNYVADGGVYSGATTDTLSVLSAQPASPSHKFRCIAYNDGFSPPDPLDDFNNALSSEATLTVTPLTPATFTLGSPTTFAYNGSPQGPTVVPNPAGATYTVSAGSLSQTNAGNYSVTLTATSPYVGTSGPLNWSITKIAQSAPAALTSAATTTFNSGYVATVASGFGNVTWTLVTGAGGSTASGAAVNATTGAITSTGIGNVVVKAAYAGDTNHTASPQSGNLTVTVTKAAATVTLGNLTQAYNGSPRPVTVTTVPASLTVTVTYNTVTTVPSADGSYAVVATVNEANYQGTASGTLTITKPPAFTQQPVSLTRTVGGSATFTAAANGTPTPGYQWKKNGVNIPGATNASYTITGVQFSDAAGYTVVASNSVGSVTSNVATLVVNETPLAAGEKRVWLMNGTTPQASISLGQPSAGWEMAATGDFNGDGKPDIVWQNLNTGQRVIWLMNGTTFLGGGELGFVDITWRIVGTGDFNGDGKADLLWQNLGTGQRVIWLMNGTTFIGGAELGFVDISWQMAGVGDFNGDNKPDIVWQNLGTGQRVIWLMNGTAFMAGAELGFVDVAWQIAAVGDFNADGKADIFWQNRNTGQRSLWYMNGTALQEGVNLWTRDIGIDLAGVGDFNGDGKMDVLWQESSALPSDFNSDWMGDLVLENTATGERRLWLLDQNLGVTGAILPTLDTNWRLAAAMDLNQDGKTDLLLRNRQTGLCRAWYLDGPNFVSEENLWVVEPNWEIAATADMNRDGQLDLLWQNRATGQRSVWYMNGKSYLNGENLWVVDPNWDLVAAVDLNRDGQADLLWQNRGSGQRSVWYMNGTTLVSGENLWMVDPNWDLVGVRDLNRDGSVDLVWQHRISGQRSVWYLNGTTYLSGVNLWVLDPNWRFAF